MATVRRLFVAVLACTAVSSAAEPALFDLVMPDAHVLFGVNLRRIFTSPVGADIRSQLQNSNPEIQKLLNQVGFDPTQDLDEILFAASGDPSSRQQGLFLARGKFDVAKLSGLFSGQGITSTTYKGVTLMSHPSQKASAVGFLDNTVLIGGDPVQVRAAIDRRSRASAIDAALYAKARDMSDRYEIWGISAGTLVPPTANVPEGGLKQVGELLKSIRQFSGGIRFGSDVQVAAELLARTEKDATSLADGLRFFGAMFAASQMKASATPPPELKLDVEGRTVRIAMTISEEDLRKAYQARRAVSQQAAVMPPAAPIDTGLTIQSSDKDMGTVKLAPAKKD